MVPMMGAVAAGNCVILKPSDISVATSKLLADLIPRYMDNVGLQKIYCNI